MNRFGTSGSSPSSHSVTTINSPRGLSSMQTKITSGRSRSRTERAALARLDATGLDRLADPRGDLRARVERAADALQVALDGVVGDRDEGHRSLSSPNTGDSGSSATWRIASRTPGMKLVRSVVTWRMVRRLGDVAEDHVLVGDEPGQAHGVDRHVALHRAAVRAAVPDGLSSLPAWWYSMISADRMCLEASAAKRIISTAPIAKLAAAKTLPGRAGHRCAQVVVVPAGGADHDVHAGVRGLARRCRRPASGA